MQFIVDISANPNKMTEKENATVTFTTNIDIEP